MVGDGKEFVEKEPNDDVTTAERIELNSSVSGIISGPTDVDYYRFAGKRGQRVVFSCLTTSIDSRLLAEIQVYQGDRLLVSNRNYHHNDALCDVVLPLDGDYGRPRICSFSYTYAGTDCYYRLTVSTAPWIDAIHPCVVERGKPTDVTVYGRNLPGGKPDPDRGDRWPGIGQADLSRHAAARGADHGCGNPTRLQRLHSPQASMLDGFEVRLQNESGRSNGFLLALANPPVVLDNEANDTPKTAQAVTLPCEIAGRIEKKGDRDWYVFPAKKGQVVSIELYGDRLGALLDLSLLIRNAKTEKTVVELDDTIEVMSPHFYSATDDPPRYRFVAPADGDYQVLVRAGTPLFRPGRATSIGCGSRRSSRTSASWPCRRGAIFRTRPLSAVVVSKRSRFMSGGSMVGTATSLSPRRDCRRA